MKQPSGQREDESGQVSVAAILSGIGKAEATRFAPSPTGELHLGHVLHMEWLWSAAIALGARVVVRSEDHDRSRSSSEFEQSILDDMTWLGYAPEPESLASLRSGRPSAWRQSDCSSRYRDAVDRLSELGLTYHCD